MILVVGSTGLLGSEICRLLAEKQVPFRALVRRDSAPEKVDRLKSLGAELALGDLKTPVSIAAACEGIEIVISTASSTFSRREGDSIESVDHQGQLNLVRVAEEAGVKRFVFISFRPNPDHPSPLSAAKQAVERALAESGMSWCSLRANFFMEIWLNPAVGFNYPQWQANIYGTGEQKISWVSFRDVAAFALTALDSPFAVNRIVEVGGPAALSPNEVVRRFENASGHPFAVQYVPAADLAQKKVAATNPMEETFAALMLEYAAGNVMDMGDTLRHLPVRLTPVEEYVRGVVGKL